MSDEITSQGPEGSGINRRTVMKGAAWSVPVIVVATSAPAMAASEPVFFNITGGACKLPGNSSEIYKGYAFGLTFTNTFASAVNVTITSMSLDTVPVTLGLVQEYTQGPPQSCSSNVNPFSVSGLGTKKVAVFSVDAPNSSVGTLTVSYSWTGASSGSATVSKSFTGSTWPSGCRPFTPWENATPSTNGCSAF